MNNALQIAAAIYICIVLFFWMYSFFKGRKIVNYLKLYHPMKWEELDKPIPDYLNSTAIHKWKKFISQKGYLVLQDKKLNSLCEDQKRLERNTVILTIIFFLIFGGIAIWFKYLK